MSHILVDRDSLCYEKNDGMGPPEYLISPNGQILVIHDCVRISYFNNRRQVGLISIEIYHIENFKQYQMNQAGKYQVNGYDAPG